MEVHLDKFSTKVEYGDLINFEAKDLLQILIIQKDIRG